MSLYDRAKFILTANAYKAGKLYSLKGSDLVFSRSSIGTRINPSGNIVSVANNIPRLHHGSSSKILIEDAATNLAYNSNLIHSSVVPNNITLNHSESPSGEIDATYIRFGTSINTDLRLPINVPIEPSTSYILSFWLKAISGNGSISVRIDTNSTTLLVDSNNLSASSEWLRYSVPLITNGTSTYISVSSQFRNKHNNNNGEFLVWGIQLEEGSAASSLIPTTGTAQTRAADQPESFNPVSLGYLLANQGSIVINNTVYKYTTDGNLETFINGVSQGTTVDTPPTSWTLPIGETERVLMFDYPLTTDEIEAL